MPTFPDTILLEWGKQFRRASICAGPLFPCSPYRHYGLPLKWLSVALPYLFRWTRAYRYDSHLWNPPPPISSHLYPRANSDMVHHDSFTQASMTAMNENTRIGNDTNPSDRTQPRTPERENNSSRGKISRAEWRLPNLYFPLFLLLFDYWNAGNIIPWAVWNSKIRRQAHSELWFVANWWLPRCWATKTFKSVKT